MPVAGGTKFQFSVVVNGMAANLNPTYNWTISSGTIVSGQGTYAITVDPGTEAGSCTATVELGGLPAKCNGTASSTAEIRKAPEKILSSSGVSARSLQEAVKQFVSKTDLSNIALTQTAIINIQSTNAQQFTNLRAILDKAFQDNGIFTYQYTIIDAGVARNAAIDMFLDKGGY
jgi:hypothetical protein